MAARVTCWKCDAFTGGTSILRKKENDEGRRKIFFEIILEFCPAFYTNADEGREEKSVSVGMGIKKTRKRNANQ